MILFELKCQDGHGFDAWFRDGATYDAQSASGEIACPVCGDTRVVKAPMAPRIAKNTAGDPPAAAPLRSESGSAAAPIPVVAGELQAQLEGLRRKIEENCDPVGDRFAEEARRIHYGEAPQRNIYGQATEADAVDLAEEGIEFARIPWPVRTDS